MLFTAKQHTKKQGVHGDYNKKLLDMFLEKFVDAMGKGKDGEVFWSVVGCTDNDARERYALDRQMEGLYLLLCLFHIWQAWRTSLNSSLQSIPKGNSRKEVWSRLAQVVLNLLCNVGEYKEVVKLYNAEVRHWKAKGTKKATAMEKKQSTAALKFLTYFQSYVSSKDVWVAWSPAGAAEAAC